MSVMVLIGCPTCGRRYRYDARRFGATGVRIRCRTCESVMRVDIPEGLRPGDGEATAEAFPAGVPAPGTAPPAAADQEPRPEPPEPIQEPAPAPQATAGRQALVADRDPDLRAFLASCLRSDGWLVHEVADGPSARRALAAHRPALLVVNAFLPKVLGVTLCAEVKRHPELAATKVLLVGSLYRRDRFMRDPGDLYGADGFLDGSGPREDLRRALGAWHHTMPDVGHGKAPASEDTLSELRRLARTVVGDIILYNAESAEQELAAGRFFEAFAHELKEGEALIRDRFSGLEEARELYRSAVREAVSEHRAAAGMPAEASR
jgi:CheY-like chemotaxis protein